ncbi:hypothetical protein HDU98_003026 [Podochytrium sp. JEL0797]|nr:hypothetical protein HDU98_003026 [Podochytrium sp. JEL0797]
MTNKAGNDDSDYLPGINRIMTVLPDYIPFDPMLAQKNTVTSLAEEKMTDLPRYQTKADPPSIVASSPAPPPPPPMSVSVKMILSQPSDKNSILFSNHTTHTPIYTLTIEPMHSTDRSWFLEPITDLLQNAPELPKFNLAAPDLELLDTSGHRLATLLPYKHYAQRYGYKIYRSTSTVDKKTINRDEIQSEHLMELRAHEFRQQTPPPSDNSSIISSHKGKSVLQPVLPYTRERLDNSFPLDEGRVIHSLGQFTTERGMYQWMHDDFFGGTKHRQDPLNAKDDAVQFKLYFTQAVVSRHEESKRPLAFLSELLSRGEKGERKVIATFTTSKSEVGVGGVFDYRGDGVDEKEAGMVACTVVAALMAYKFRVQRYIHKQK